MHQGLVPVQELLLVDAGGAGDEEPLPGGHHGVLQDVGRELVDVELGILADGDVSEAHRRSLLGKEHIQHHRVEAVVIPAPLPVVRVVLAGIEQGVPYEFYIVQYRLSGRAALLVIPVHHHALAAGVHRVVVDVLLDVDGPSAQVPLVLRVLLLQQLLVHQLREEQVAGLLDVGDARLPEQFEQVDLPDVDVAQAVLLLGVPKHTVGRRAVFELVPPVVRISLLIVVVLQQDGQDGGQRPCALLVAALPGEHHRLGVVVHGVGVLVEDGVEQPGGGGLRAFPLFPLVPADGLPVAQLPPQLILHDARLQAGFPLLVAGEGVDGFGELLPPDGGPCFRPGAEGPHQRGRAAHPVQQRRRTGLPCALLCHSHGSPFCALVLANSALLRLSAPVGAALVAARRSIRVPSSRHSRCGLRCKRATGTFAHAAVSSAGCAVRLLRSPPRFLSRCGLGAWPGR